MRRPQGYGVIVMPDAKVREADTFTCTHCQRIVFVQPLASPSAAGGWCSRCDALICGPCAETGRCTPFEVVLERMEARGRFLRSAGLS